MWRLLILDVVVHGLLFWCIEDERREEGLDGRRVDGTLFVNEMLCSDHRMDTGD